MNDNSKFWLFFWMMTFIFLTINEYINVVLKHECNKIKDKNSTIELKIKGDKNVNIKK